MSRLVAQQVTLAYGGDPVVDELTLAIPDGKVSVIVGPNACGKSTLLRAMARLLSPRSGVVHLDGEAIGRQPTRQVAMRLGLLPQGPSAPEGLTVEDLVGRGRFPYRGLLRQWTPQDERAVDEALALTGTGELRHRPVDDLSGGQRQRVWIAMALAQDTPIMLLDEPTTYLDLAHRTDVLDLLAELNEAQGRTVVMVLHDLNEACRYADHVVAMAKGRIVDQGLPGDVITASLVEQVFGLACQVFPDPVTGTPLVVPLARRRARRSPLATPPGSRARSGEATLDLVDEQAHPER
jgi:iron complex transport system ATP-binding protein